MLTCNGASHAPGHLVDSSMHVVVAVAVDVVELA